MAKPAILTVIIANPTANKMTLDDNQSDEVIRWPTIEGLLI
jgi:hypothetical protein